ncbi:MAG: DNA repair protein RecO [Patescibacteria group bacterium]
MFVHYRTKGMIIKKEDRGEADQLFTAYTEDFGKLEILGKAIRKTASKLRAGAEIFYLSEIEFIQGKGYKTLTDAILIEKFKNLRRDLNRLKVACQISEILDDLIRGQERDEEIWELLSDIFKKLNNLQFPQNNLQLIYHYFLFNFLSILGYQMELYACTSCAKKITPAKIYFSPREGGAICQNCAGMVRYAKVIDAGIVKILRIILKKNWKLLAKIKMGIDHSKELESVSKSYLTYVLSSAK